MKRVFLIVLDSLGIGHAPDAKKFSENQKNFLEQAGTKREKASSKEARLFH